MKDNCAPDMYPQRTLDLVGVARTVDVRPALQSLKLREQPSDCVRSP
jgi:hypothetical protein